MPKQQRTRGRKWMRIREEVLRDNPLCAICLSKGVITQATQVDHIIALINEGTDDRDNLQSLCEACHEEKTNKDLGRMDRPAIGADGWPISD